MWFSHEKKQTHKKDFLFEKKGHIDNLKMLNLFSENVSIPCGKPKVIIPLYF